MIFGTDKMLALLPMDDPSPVGFVNVYEKGDVWIKVRGCVECPRNCCGKCPMIAEDKCYLHLVDHGNHKPFICVIKPDPITKHDCSLVWECVQGSRKGKFRWKCDAKDVFRDVGP